MRRQRKQLTGKNRENTKKNKGKGKVQKKEIEKGTRKELNNEEKKRRALINNRTRENTKEMKKKNELENKELKRRGKK